MKTIMRIRYILIVLAALLCISTTGWSQNVEVSGKVVDKNGKPISGTLVYVTNGSSERTTTNVYGDFRMNASPSDVLEIKTSNNCKKQVKVDVNAPMVIVIDHAAQAVDMGFGIEQTTSESTGAISRTTKEELNKRSAFSISNSLYGNVLGLTSLQNSGPIWDAEPTMYVRGLQTLSDNSVLILVDGFERDIKYVVPEEVESVSILRDASAVALYGYRGINGVISITTIRGKYNSSEINVSYDHAFNTQTRLPKFANAFTYASAMNEALSNDGKAARYSQNELDAFNNGTYPYLYPNVNWVDEVFRDQGSSNIYNVNFRGGGTKMRYYTMFNLQDNQGFIDNTDMNEGYSTQEKFSKGNIRTNLDIDLSPSTLVQVNLMGVLNEFSRPGLGGDNLIGKLYTTPSAAFPIQTEDGIWGGNKTWGDLMNPVALTQARGYSKGHTRSLYADMKLTQKLDFITNGLSASVRLGYDNVAAYWEGHNRTYAYASDAVTTWDSNKPANITRYKAGADSELGFSNKLDWQDRHSNFVGNVDYQFNQGSNNLFASLIYSFENRVRNSQNNTYFRQNVAAYAHYTRNNTYVADLTLVSSASNKLATGEKWNYSPTLGLAWILSNESFLNDVSAIDFMKLRASWGIINSDNIPTENYWAQSFGGGGGYSLGKNYEGYSGTMEGRLPALNSTCEKALKSNLGFDLSFLKGFVLTTDVYYEKRKDIWVSAGGANSSVLGVSSPYANAGIVNSWGIESGLNYNKQLGDVKIALGGKFTFAKNEIEEMLEEPKAYDYLRATGNPVSQIFGLQAVGFFIDEADINNSPAQQFSEVKAGDIKYKDQNSDGIINGYDKIAMGYNTSVPEIYYSFDLGIEWKGLGVSATFQGVENYTAILNTQSMYWPLINNTTISEHYYENRWTPETPFAKYPRLTTESNDNNFQTNSVWLADASFLKLRNCEVYYKLPATALSRMGMTSAKFYVRGVDLVSFDKIELSDPESVGVSYPMTRSVSIGFAIGF